ncbi:unnamed protein product [Protopolystoma xenopodis]|uniref:methenyltetrahydrofolate cyclohydrolase n=1 Tax=Protopolystoma xenopodis TaxID=117903 RepID=A0A448XI21_9PLAT|nr:unnamed protein product [Protopolystoma xenopodis]
MPPDWPHFPLLPSSNFIISSSQKSSCSNLLKPLPSVASRTHSNQDMLSTTSVSDPYVHPPLISIGSNSRSLPPSLSSLPWRPLQLVHLPCTVLSCLALLSRTSVHPKCGARCVVIGHGRLAGAPVADCLSSLGRASVTICQEATRDLADEVGRADILVCAIGRVGVISSEWIKPGSVVIDFGVNILPPELDTNSECKSK